MISSAKRKGTDLHGLEIRWAIVPYKEKPSDLKKRPVVVLRRNNKKARILRITSQFEHKNFKRKFSEYKIGKFHPLQPNGLAQTSYIDLGETQTIPSKLLLSHVGFLSFHATRQLLRAGYRFQKRGVKQEINHYQQYFLKAIPKYKFKTQSHNWNNYHVRNTKPLTRKQRKVHISKASKKIAEIKKLNRWSR